MLSIVKKQLAQQRKQQQLRQQQQQQPAPPTTTTPSTAPSPSLPPTSHSTPATATTAAKRSKRARASTTVSTGQVSSIFDQARAAREQVDYLSSNVAYLTRTSARLQQIRQLHQHIYRPSRSGSSSNKRRKGEQPSKRQASERDDYDEMEASEDAND